MLSSQEIRYFLPLLREKQVLDVIDGKTLMTPMKEMGYIRDPVNN